jgi:selenide,water dikinase
MDGELALIQTVDFFPPIVDDPRWFGRVAAANALSDVYAMGGRPLTALNIVVWPTDLDVGILGEVVRGGREKVEEAGAVLAGGHSVTGPVIMYGLAVTGEAHPATFWRNSTAQEGDVLLLTKPLGMSPVATAMKKQLADAETIQRAVEQMATLNRAAAEAVADLPVHAATDVTGFGIMGHGAEMAAGAGLTLHLASGQIPIFQGALEFARQGLVSGGCKRGRANLEGRYSVGPEVEGALQDILFDAETSGGLLLAMPEAAATKAQGRLRDAGTLTAALVGRFVAGGQMLVVVD